MFIIIMSAFLCQAVASNLHPIILVPGAGGNQLEARLNKHYKPSSIFCNRWYPVKKHTNGWFRLWFDPTVLISPFTDCYAQRMMIYYNRQQDDFTNAPGVETRVPQFGSVSSLLYLDPSLKKASNYMSTLVSSLEEIGYIRDESLFGAPYDFRYGLAAEGHPSRIGTKFLEDLRSLVERASAKNEGKKVIILSHSLGGLFVLNFLNRISPKWKDTHIKHFIALSTPWGGTIDQMRTFASGNTLGVPLVDPLRLREMQRSSESNLWLLPSPLVFGDRVLVTTPGASYSARDIPRFLDDIGCNGSYPYARRILPLTEQLSAPEVPVTCVVGSEVETTERLEYKDGGFDERPEIVRGDGDGTVNLESLLAVKLLWANHTSQRLSAVVLPGISHSDILKHEKALKVISEEIKKINNWAPLVACS